MLSTRTYNRNIIYNNKATNLRKSHNFCSKWYPGEIYEFLVKMVLIVPEDVLCEKSNYAPENLKSCFITRHEGARVERYIAPTHSSPRQLGSVWVVYVTPRPRFTPGKRTPGTHWTGDWVGPRPGLDTEDRGKVPSPLLGMEPRSPCRSARIQTLYWLSYSAPRNL
jgi:hypothetical protein